MKEENLTLREVWSQFYTKKEGEKSYRTATTHYPCCISALGEFARSKSYDSHRLQK